MGRMWRMLLLVVVLGLLDALYASCPPVTTMVLAGDSTMAYAMDALSKLFACKKVKAADRCLGNLQYYSKTPLSDPVWTPGTPPGTSIPDWYVHINETHKPDYKGAKPVGPCIYGNLHRGCMDCSSSPRAYECSHNGQPLRIESLGMEFARDMDTQSKKYRFSQEVIAEYLKDNYKRIDVFVLSVGLHDIGCSKADHVSYRSNLDWAMKLMPDNIVKRIYITSSSASARQAAPGKWVNLTRNQNILKFNSVAQTVAMQNGYDVLDAYPLSVLPMFQDSMRDHLHYGSAYYKVIVDLILDKICSEERKATKLRLGP